MKRHPAGSKEGGKFAPDTRGKRAPVPAAADARLMAADAQPAAGGADLDTMLSGLRASTSVTDAAVAQATAVPAVAVEVDEDGNCPHGMNPEWCAPCRNPAAERAATRSTSDLRYASDMTRQERADDIAARCGVPTFVIRGEDGGGIEPNEWTASVAASLGVSTDATRSADIARAIVEHHGQEWPENGSFSGWPHMATPGWEALHRTVKAARPFTQEKPAGATA